MSLILIDLNKCLRCGACAAVCKENAIDISEFNIIYDEASCNDCLACVKTCPLGAVSRRREKDGAD
jgi:ferredoxin